MERDGFMRKDLQIKVKNSYQLLFHEILEFIEEKYVPDDKKGILVPLAEQP
jgi:hypothetical protein